MFRSVRSPGVLSATYKVLSNPRSGQLYPRPRTSWRCLASSGRPEQTSGSTSNSTIPFLASTSPLREAVSSSSAPLPSVTTRPNLPSSSSTVALEPQPNTDSSWNISLRVVIHPTRSRCGAMGAHMRWAFGRCSSHPNIRRPWTWWRGFAT